MKIIRLRIQAIYVQRQKKSLQTQPFKCYIKSGLLKIKLNLFNDLRVLRSKAMLIIVEFLQRNETYNETQTSYKMCNHTL
jgi:hypothetical protein